MIRNITDKEFDAIVAEGFHIIDVYSTHCVPCKQLSLILDEIEKELPQLSILKINIDDNKDFVSRFQIMSVPVLMYYKDGELLEKTVGLQTKSNIFEFLSEYMY